MRRTVVRHVASYLLVAVAIMLLVRLTPDIGTLLGIEGLIEPVNDRLPAAADAVGGAAAVVLAIFTFGDAVANGVAMSVPSACAAAGMTYLTRGD